MATTASYRPIVGNFGGNFSFINSVGDPIPVDPSPGVGPGRSGLYTFALVLVIGAGPVGDDVSFTLAVPHPTGFTQAEVDANENALYPIPSYVPGVAGTAAQDLFISAPVPNVAQQTVDFAIGFGAGVPALTVVAIGADFGHTITD